MILFIIVYLAALFCYFFTRTSGKKTPRMINKYIMATMYLVYAFVVFYKRYEFASIQILLMAALLLAWLGDIFLVFDFGRGGDFFLAGNVCFVLYEEAVLKDHGYKIKDFAWTYVVVAIMLAACIWACQKYPKKIKMGKMRWPMTFYLSSIFMHGITGLALITMLSEPRFVVLGIGSFLFMISDMILTSYKFIFDNNKWLVRANSLTYFTGLLLIVLSTSL